jgi:hypothetical protein
MFGVVLQMRTSWFGMLQLIDFYFLWVTKEGMLLDIYPQPLKKRLIHLIIYNLQFKNLKGQIYELLVVGFVERKMPQEL